MGPYQGPRGQHTQGLLHERLGIQFLPDQERAFWREEIPKVVTYWNAAPGEEEPDTQPRATIGDGLGTAWTAKAATELRPSSSPPLVARLARLPKPGVIRVR